MYVIRELPPIAYKGDWVSIDTEIYGLQKHQLHRPSFGGFASIQICSSAASDMIYVCTDERQLPEVFRRLQDASIWVFQNAKFDLTHLRRWVHIEPRNIWDTMLIDIKMFSGYYQLFGLDDLVRRWLHIELDKSLQKSFLDNSELTDEQLEYAANDAYYTLQVAQAQRKEISKPVFESWKNVEMPTLWAVLDFQPIRLDDVAWQNLAEENKKKATELEKTLSFNPRSSKQVVDTLRKTGFKGLPDSQEKTLVKWLASHPNTEAASLTKTILECRGFAKQANTYGMKFIRDYLETESAGVKVIATDYHQLGSETGRFSSSKPNMQNIPSRETKLFRECFIARPGNKLVIADYGQQEVRIAAYLSKDAELTKILKNAAIDIFVGMVKLIYNQEVDKKHALRNLVKNLTYGLIYGLSTHGLAERAGISLKESEETSQKFFTRFYGLATWIAQQQRNRNYVTTVSNVRLWLNPYSGQAERNAINAPIQGTAAEMMKMAIIKCHKEWNSSWGKFGIVATIHDELILDVPEKFAQDVATFVTNNMIEVAENLCPGIPFIADAVIGDNWAAKG